MLCSLFEWPIRRILIAGAGDTVSACATGDGPSSLGTTLVPVFAPRNCASLVGAAPTEAMKRHSHLKVQQMALTRQSHCQRPVGEAARHDAAQSGVGYIIPNADRGTSNTHPLAHSLPAAQLLTSSPVVVHHSFRHTFQLLSFYSNSRDAFLPSTSRISLRGASARRRPRLPQERFHRRQNVPGQRPEPGRRSVLLSASELWRDHTNRVLQPIARSAKSTTSTP